MSDDNQTTRSRWVLPSLFISLAANLLIVGIVIGIFFVSGGERPDRTSREVGALVGPHFFRALEPADRRALIRDVARQRDKVRENRAELRQRLERLHDLLQSETLDTAAVRALLAEQRASISSRHKLGEELLLRRLAEMTPEARQAFADRLAASLRDTRRD